MAIQINYVDNELIVIASQPAFSSTLAHVKSGYNAVTPLTINPNHILPSGTYTLQLIGVNWGGPGRFDVTVNGEAVKWNSSSGTSVDTKTMTLKV